MIGAAFTAFKLLPLAWRIGTIAGAASIVIGLYAYWHYSVYSSGYAAAIADVKAENKEGTDAALKNIERRRACNGTWDQSLGLCFQH
jgi:hypothetical protein